MTRTQSNGTCVIENCLTMWVHPKRIRTRHVAQQRHTRIDRFLLVASFQCSYGCPRVVPHPLAGTNMKVWPLPCRDRVVSEWPIVWIRFSVVHTIGRQTVRV